MRYRIVRPGCILKQMREGDAGYDLCAGEDMEIEPQSTAVVPLGIAVAIPEGQYGLLIHRSSLAFKRNAVISTGIIDSSFKQEMKAKVFNMSYGNTLYIRKGERIAQLIFHHFVSPELEVVDDMEDGKGGFGSSGVS